MWEEILSGNKQTGVLTLAEPRTRAVKLTAWGI